MIFIINEWDILWNYIKVLDLDLQNKVFFYLPTQPFLAWVAGGATNNILSPAVYTFDCSGFQFIIIISNIKAPIPHMLKWTF